MFKKFNSRLRDTTHYRNFLGNEPLSFGNSFLDHALGGIYPDDFVVVTAKTGFGKTELVTHIASVNAEKKKRVHFFALEAHFAEIESRIKFKALSQAFFTQYYWRDFNEVPNYQDWLYGKQKDLLDKFDSEVEEELSKKYETLFTFYRDREFNADTFESFVHQISENTDLIIVDHLHYFDFEDEENKALKNAVKQIRDVTSFYRKPVVLVVQLRKHDKKNNEPLPALEDIYGSSDISKIATRIVATAPAFNEKQEDKYGFPTYMRALKNRTDGSRTRYVGITSFDTRRNCYSEKYLLGELDLLQSQVNHLDFSKYPAWARKNL